MMSLPLTHFAFIEKVMIDCVNHCRIHLFQVLHILCVQRKTRASSLLRCRLAALFIVTPASGSFYLLSFGADVRGAF